MIAQAIHNDSKRSSGRFVAVNCATIVPSLVESELFGYEDGAFTGAKKGGKIGLFEIANGGTIFLDEIGEISLEVQANLLRVLEEGTIRKIGSEVENKTDVRVIAATNKDLMKGINDGTFREDLYYRLNVVNIELPSLKERDEDIKLLAESFLKEQSLKNKRNYKFDEYAVSILLQYKWPGNIRELRNAIEYSINMCDDNIIKIEHFPCSIQSINKMNNTGKLSELVKEFEKQAILSCLKKYGNSLTAKRQIANELGISLATLYKKLNE